MFALLKNSLAYAEIRTRLVRDAEFECQRMTLSAEQLIVEAFKKSNMSMTGRPMMGRGKANTRTPEQLKGVIEVLLSYPPVLSAWLVRYHIARALTAANLPMHVQGDLMMTLENANYVFPDKAETAAAVLACALCMQPWLWLARSTLFGLGVPLGNERSVSEDQFQTAVRHGYLPQDVKLPDPKAIVLGWNCEMRAKVADALERIDSRLSAMMRLQKFRRIRKRPLERWAHKPDEQGVSLLAQGIELAGQGQLEQAYSVLDEAGRKDSVLMPDVLRNQEWILSKQGKYAQAAELARKALAIDPGYREVWYALGIDLAKMGQYPDALDAYEKAKELGHRSSGLEHNIQVCRRACGKA
jgi:tetratricopeptide (TPR) repeat protein